MEKISELTNKIGLLGTILVGLLLGASVFALGYFYLISPLQEENRLAETEAKSTEMNVAKLKVLTEDREIIEQRGAEIYANYLKGSRLLPNGEQISQVIEAIEGKAGQNGTQVLSFDAFKPGVKSQGSEVSERVVEGELKGSHEALVGFLRSISYYERITEVRAISAFRDEKGGERMKFVLAAYYLPSQLQIPEPMQRKAYEILKNEGFDIDNPTVNTQLSSDPKSVNSK